MDCALALLCGPGVRLEPTLGPLEDLRSLFEEVLLVAPSLGPLLGTGRRLVAGLSPGDGVLAGIHAALVVARADEVLVLSAAAPLPSRADLGALAQHPGHANVVLLGGTGPLAPLPGRYRKGCVRALRRALRQGLTDPAAWLGALHPARL